MPRKARKRELIDTGRAKDTSAATIRDSFTKATMLADRFRKIAAVMPGPSPPRARVIEAINGDRDSDCVLDVVAVE